MISTTTSGFPIPSSLQDLEREPYNLLPYPHDFDDGDEAARADSFSALVDFIDQGNQSLLSDGITLFQNYEGQPLWLQNDRIQALYTLVRKFASLSRSTRWGLINVLCQAVKGLASILDEEEQEADDAGGPLPTSHVVVSQQFRDAVACHLYMLFSVLFIIESETKIGSNLKSGKNRTDSQDTDDVVKMRTTCSEALLDATKSMARNRHRLWTRGVPDESVVSLPCRIAYQMLEGATGVLARKACSADAAIGIIAATVDAYDFLLGTVLAALMDMLHSFEHMALICAELCCAVSEKPTNRLAVELIREVGRLDTSTASGADGGKASGIKFVAPFIHELALRRPRIVLSNISHLLPHLDSEPYNLRSAIVTALGHIVEYIGKIGQNPEEDKDSQSGTQDSDSQRAGPSSLNMEKSRATLLEILLVRSHDSSSYTRSAVLKTWIGLSLSETIPISQIHAVTEMAIDRLQDKTVMVRKQALQLLTTLLENNPYMRDLDPEPYRQKLSDLCTYIFQNLPSDLKEAHQAALNEAGDNEDAVAQLERATLAAAIAEAGSISGSDVELNNQDSEFRSKVEALKFAQSALEFIDQFESASANLQGMLLSANTSDVTEGLRFFVQARHFKLPCAVTGMKGALKLMWSSEQNIREEVLKAFVDVFIAVPGTERKEYLPSDQIAYNLLSLAGEATVSELASIEEAVKSLVKEGRIPPEVFSILWSASTQGPGSSRATAIQVLAMAAHADEGIVNSKSRLKALLDTALGDYTEERRDWQVARAAAIVLQHVERAEVDPSCAKYLVLERIMERLCAVTRGDWCVDTNETDTTEWFAAAEEALGALFVIAPEPEVSCSEILRGMYQQTLGDSSLSDCHPLRLARFFHVLGHIALKLLVYSEALSASVRQGTVKRTLKKQEEADRMKADGTKAGGKEEDIEAELGMAAEVEAENERKMAEIAEREIVGRGLLGIFGPILVRVVVNEGNLVSSSVLRQTSTLALCKFMCVSCSFCEKHLPVIFSALANAPADDLVLRANTVIALGDLAFRFPNEVEPYTPRIYACLRDSSTMVRRHTLMVLTHLILNDMVKVKGQVCEIAMCLRDDDQRIRDTSRLLFHELSKRSNNPVYNLLPDVISQLSQAQIQKDDFRSIMSFLLGFIAKERQNEMLVDKLCQRFPKCTSIEQKADIAYCLAQLKVNERSIKILVDNFKLYKDSLFDDDVKRHFVSIIAKAKKFAKPEMKQALEEFERNIDEQSALGIDNKRARDKASLAKAQASRRGPRKAKQLETLQEWEEDDDEADEESSFLDQDEEKENINNHHAPSVSDEVVPSRESSRGKTRRTRVQSG